MKFTQTMTPLVLLVGFLGRWQDDVLEAAPTGTLATLGIKSSYHHK